MLRKQLAGGKLDENTYLGKISKSLEDSVNSKTWLEWKKYFEFRKNPINASLIWDIEGNVKKITADEFVAVSAIFFSIKSNKVTLSFINSFSNKTRTHSAHSIS